MSSCFIATPCDRSKQNYPTATTPLMYRYIRRNGLLSGCCGRLRCLSTHRFPTVSRAIAY
ncbi:MAG: hypothetical protein HC866_17830 [Leptolyngbyaceae cyanobacterium RU_5_1]|nr:hypothetical protein [Leptolyngbyaceae cyanobacterium RU_5_1]